MGELTLPIRSPPERAVAGRLSSDERLARLVSKGSARAFSALYQRHHQALYRYCRSIVRDENDAQDVLQNAMTRAFVALRAQERDLAVKPWLFRIAHNEAVSILRRRHPTVALAEELEPADLAVERTLEGRERLATLVADLQALPERQRSALLMRELSGLSIEEIAGVLSSSPGAIKQVLFEARRALHDFAEGRAMECEQVRRAISDGDRRVLRGRKLRGHLRECSGCRDFQVAIPARSADLRALAPPLPGVAAAAMLGRLLSHGLGGGHSGGLAGSGAALGNSAAVSLTAKGLVGVATVTVAVAGGARLALVHGQHGHPRSTTSQGASVVPTRRAGARATAAASQADTPLSETAATKRGGAIVPSAAQAARAHDNASSSGRASAGTISGLNDRTSAGHGSSRAARGGGGSMSNGRNSAHRFHTGRTGSKQLASSRPAHSGSGNHKLARPQPAKPRSGHGRTPPATGQPRARAPSVQGVRPEASGAAQEHGVPPGTPPGGGRLPSTAAPESKSS